MTLIFPELWGKSVISKHTVYNAIAFTIVWPNLKDRSQGFTLQPRIYSRMPTELHPNSRENILTRSLPNILIIKSTTGHCSLLPYANFLCNKTKDVYIIVLSLGTDSAYSVSKCTESFTASSAFLTNVKKSLEKRVRGHEHATTCPHWLFSPSYSTPSSYNLHTFPNTSSSHWCHGNIFLPFSQQSLSNSELKDKFETKSKMKHL